MLLRIPRLLALVVLVAGCVRDSEPQTEGTPAVVLPMHVHGAPLFPDERARVERRVRDALRANGFNPLRGEDLDAIRRSPEGRSCSTRSAFAALLSKRFPDRVRVPVAGECRDGRCTLSVVVRERGAPELNWNGSVAFDAGPEAWAAVVSDAAGRPVRPLPSHNEDAPRAKAVSAGDSPYHPRLTIDAADSALAMSVGTEARRLFGRLSACHRRPQFGISPHADTFRLTLLVDGRGRVHRCVSEGELEAASKLGGCTCEVLGEMKLPAGGNERRVVIGLDDGDDRNHGAEFGGRRLSATVSDFDELGTWERLAIEHGAEALARCLPAGVKELRPEISIAYDAEGRVADVKLSGRAFDAPLAQCLDAAARTIPPPCAATGWPAKLTFSPRLAEHVLSEEDRHALELPATIAVEQDD